MLAANANARRCCQCGRAIAPPRRLDTYVRAIRAGVALSGFCSLKCQAANALLVVTSGSAWWQQT